MLIANQALQQSDEYFRLHHRLPPSGELGISPPRRHWYPLSLGSLKVNTDVVFSEGIGIVVRNHLGIPLFAKTIERQGTDYVEYSELLGIIEGYVFGSPLSARLIIESDSLLAISCLSLDQDDYLNLEP